MLNANQQKLLDLWEKHTNSEFIAKDIDATIATMTENPYVHNVPTMAGGVGQQGVRNFYTNSFVYQLPPDTETQLISRTIGETQIVDETIFKFTHTIRMDWMLPGIEPTGKRVEVALVAIVGFKDDKISHEHIYWDQASVLVQIGLLSHNNLPVKGLESANRIKELAATL